MPYVDIMFGNETEAQTMGEKMGWAMILRLSPKGSQVYRRLAACAAVRSLSHRALPLRLSWRTASSRSTQSCLSMRKTSLTPMEQVMLLWADSLRSLRRALQWPNALTPDTG